MRGGGRHTAKIDSLDENKKQDTIDPQLGSQEGRNREPEPSATSRGYRSRMSGRRKHIEYCELNPTRRRGASSSGVEGAR